MCSSREEAAARVKQAESQLENLRKGKRPEEVAAARAQLAQAEANFKLSAADLKRTEDLVASKFLSPAKLDEARMFLKGLAGAGAISSGGSPRRPGRDLGFCGNAVPRGGGAGRGLWTPGRRVVGPFRS